MGGVADSYGPQTFALAVGEPDNPVPMPGSSLVQMRDCDIWIGPPTMPNLTVVRRIRLGQGDPAALLHSVREELIALGRRSARWWISPLSTPSNLAESLFANSLTHESDVTAMICACSSIKYAPSHIEVRRVNSLEDYIKCGEISSISFGTEQSVQKESAQVFEADQAEERVALYMALIDGRPVASARATFSPDGVVLNGGGTLPDARGRGAYRALVSARCRDAEALGIHWAVVEARHSAAPILTRLGFEPIGQIQVLFDEWSR